MDKDQLRKSIGDRVSQMSDKDRDIESRSVCRRIKELLPKEPCTICAYHPFKSEVDVRYLIKDLVDEGYEIYLPCFDIKGLKFRLFSGDADLSPGQLGVMEPSKSSKLLDPQGAKFVIVPGRAFDKLGNRLGRGNGGYDYFISAQRGLNSDTRFLGVCFECQIVNEVPVEGHDEVMDEVVTCRG
ncbi:5-formyltetrahydrofolate cyclo-ligase [Candidatus Peribacteria bacterium]|mgnify:CR=1 FL=1|jgi:5-formyltetrahydrofolate cyclo-ligase|nr:5-formyltetrahydrofolate cyclo-ligase [Candidatus Peribacteria bacterium]MBT4021684.1 5-formyltetrahydrofolate cyclo-ligase [Candidatus Peribacteria bacterium]MBT4240846.1 5-formyltetrahydrofolate cyclo-ligase [Candidatus Peribacteria bacterium]MBT4473772.1 5-formyltetrahydrofolate cyclo-ligase [Candidatus Peribacteria bacterium]